MVDFDAVRIIWGRRKEETPPTRLWITLESAFPVVSLMRRKLRVHSPSRAVSSPKDAWTDQMCNKSDKEIWSEVCILHALLWGLRHAAAHFVPTGGDWLPLSCLESKKLPLPPPSSSLPPWCGFTFEALLQVSSGLHRHSGTSFLKPCFLIRATIFFFFFLSAYLCLLLSIFWCLQPKMKGGECFPVADLEGVKGQMFW